MAIGKHRSRLQRALENCDVVLNGKRPWDPQINSKRVYRAFLTRGIVGLGEAYVDGWWDCEELDELCDRICRDRAHHQVFSLVDWADAIRTRLSNPQRPGRVGEVARRHYNLGDDLFFAMPDRRKIYSCAYWREASNLDEAQEAKLRLVCEKLDLKPGMRILDIGCGWGGAARYLAEHYHVEVIGITSSEPQYRHAVETCRGLPVEIHLQDYRQVEGRFDRIYSLGMFEHVGHRNYRRFFREVRDRLAPDGLFLLHTIGSLLSSTRGDPWVERYVFPNSMLPSARQVTDSIEGLFVLEDWQNFGADYDKTLMQWYQNFEDHWSELRPAYGEQFWRHWRYYLLSCAGSFRARASQLWQIVLSPSGVLGGYRAAR